MATERGAVEEAAMATEREELLKRLPWRLRERGAVEEAAMAPGLWC